VLQWSHQINDGITLDNLADQQPVFYERILLQWSHQINDGITPIGLINTALPGCRGSRFNGAIKLMTESLAASRHIASSVSASMEPSN
jgi:hypothetical protein